jgi:hypothetical protein
MALTHPPVGGSDWQLLAEEHSKHEAYRNYNRDGKSLRRKYQQLARTKAPTGDPNIPEHITLAYELKAAIADRMELGKGSEELVELDEVSYLSDRDEDNVADDANVLAADDPTQNETPQKESADNGSTKPKEKKRKAGSISSAHSSVIVPPSVTTRRNGSNHNILPQQTTQDLLQMMMLQMQQDNRTRE